MIDGNVGILPCVARSPGISHMTTSISVYDYSEIARSPAVAIIWNQRMDTFLIVCC
jgi:hypothetical protein